MFNAQSLVLVSAQANFILKSSHPVLLLRVTHYTLGYVLCARHAHDVVYLRAKTTTATELFQEDVRWLTMLTHRGGLSCNRQVTVLRPLNYWRLGQVILLHVDLRSIVHD